MKKRILLTNLRLKDYAGSEINCLSLANYFNSKGYYVEVATFTYDYPVKKEFENKKILVKRLTEEKLKHKDYDIIWCQHSITLDYLLFVLGIKGRRIIMSSLSV